MSEQEKMNQDVSAEETKTPAAKESKPAKAKKEKSNKDKKPGFGKRMGRFFRELKAELKKGRLVLYSGTLRHRRRHHRLDLRWHCQRRHRRSSLPLRPVTGKGESIWLKAQNGMWLTPIRVMKTP